MFALLSVFYSFLVYRSTPASVQSLCITAMNAEIYMKNHQPGFDYLPQSALDLKICSPYYTMLRWESVPDTSKLSDITMEALRHVHWHKAQEQRKLLEQKKMVAKNQEQDQDQKSFLYVYRELFRLAAACIVVLLTIALAYFVYCALKFFVGLIRMIIARCFGKCLQICTDILGDYLFWTLYVYIVRTLWNIATMFYRAAAKVLQIIDLILESIIRAFAIFLGILERLLYGVYVLCIRLVQIFLILSAFIVCVYIICMFVDLEESLLVRVLVSGLFTMLVVEYFGF
jgi:hypothetical protein